MNEEQIEQLRREINTRLKAYIEEKVKYPEGIKHIEALDLVEEAKDPEILKIKYEGIKIQDPPTIERLDWIKRYLAEEAKDLQYIEYIKALSPTEDAKDIEVIKAKYERLKVRSAHIIERLDLLKNAQGGESLPEE